mgnify:CR=1 FL=1
MFSEWSRALAEQIATGRAVVMVTQIAERGSSPRSSGTKMLVTLDNTIESLGGGHLEHQAIDRARKLIIAGEDGVFEQSYKLGSELGQCCGGEVRVLFEVFNAQAVQLYLFGAGHIAKALVPLLANLGFNLHWIDERDELFADDLPKGVYRVERDPLDCAKNLPPQSWALIMTHDHQLDFELVLSALESDFAYLGMIGSDTKAKRFMQRLEQRDIPLHQRQRLNTPIGLRDLKTKTPTEIALSIAVDFMYKRQALNETRSVACGA